MGIVKNIRAAWKAASTEQKVSIVIDIICGAGSYFLKAEMDQRIKPGHNRLERGLIGITTMGVSLAAGEAASKALSENYGGAIAAAIDKGKELISEGKKKAEAKKEEETAHE